MTYKKHYIIIWLIILITESFSATWYVDNSANSANNGTSWQDAWQGLAAINWTLISPGDVIYISGGSNTKTYNETLSINTSGTANEQIIIKPGAAHSNPNVDHSGMVIIASGQSNGINYESNSYVTVNGNDGNGNIKIRVTNAINDGVLAEKSIGIKLLYVHVYRCGTGDRDDNVQFSECSGGSEIAYCDIEDPYKDALKVSGHYKPDSFGSIIVHHNYLHGMEDDAISGDGSVDVYNNTIGPWGDWSTQSGGHPDGMQMYAGYLRIYNNVFYSDLWQASNALVFLNHAFGWNHDMNHVYVYNNIFITSGETFSGAHFYGVSIRSQGGAGNENMDDIQVINNTFVDVGWTPINVRSDDTGAQYTNFVIKNNIIYNCKQSGSSSVINFSGFDVNNSDIDFDYNLINKGNSGRGNITWRAEEYTVDEYNTAFNKNNITSVPTFIEYLPGNGLNNDLHLHSADTGAMDHGVDLSEFFKNDKDGILRPQGAGWDMGAYEYFSSSPPEPPKNLKFIRK